MFSIAYHFTKHLSSLIKSSGGQMDRQRYIKELFFSPCHIRKYQETETG